MHTEFKYIVISFLLDCFPLFTSTPPKNGVEDTLTFTSSGTYISIPPKTDKVFITISFSILASLKSSFIPPNSDFKSKFSTFSSSNFKSWEPNTAI